MTSRITTMREVEDELKIRTGRRRRQSAGAHWEFKGRIGSVTQWMYRVGRRSVSRRAGAAGPQQQRVVIKASYTVPRSGEARGVLRAHQTYLARDSASLDGKTGRFYDATEEDVDARTRVRQWEEDRHHFRFIISPERADQIERQSDGLRGYMRELLAQAERDLGTKLDWLAINHHNTDDLHAHVLVRGKRRDGTDLVIPSPYIKHGMRQAAQEIATRWIGPRTAEQVRESIQKELSAQRYTSLDAVIERHVDGERRLRLSGKGELAKDRLRRRVAARLQHLERLGLASRDRLGRWTVDAELKPKLRDLAKRNDIIKSLYARLGPRSGAVAFYDGKELTGRVVSMGSHDEVRDRRFLAIEDAHGRVLYVRPVNPHALRVLEEGSLVRLRPAQSQRQSEKQRRPAGRGYGIVEILSARSIQSQVEAEAWTWLDRQLHLRSLGKETIVTSDPALQRAAQSRQRWMAEHGYAQLQEGRYQLRPNAQQSLQARNCRRSHPPRFGALAIRSILFRQEVSSPASTAALCPCTRASSLPSPAVARLTSCLSAKCRGPIPERP